MVSTRTSWGSTVLVLTILCGCSGGPDRRFLAPTHDEYTEPLRNAVIGTPEGVQIVPGEDSVVVPEQPLTMGDGGAPEPPGGRASWSFDDCAAGSHFLLDGSGGGANAQHALGGACVAGIDGLGVDLRSAADVVQVPDEPQFTVAKHIALAAWVNPRSVDGDHPVIIKRLSKTTSFSLGIHDGNIEMAVVLTTGKTVISRAPIEPGVWTHVAGMFDGTFVFLFINGQQFGQVFGAGTVRNVFAPLRIGATTQTQWFDGTIDNVFVSTEVISKDVLTAQACVIRASTFTLNPAVGGPVSFDTPVHYQVLVNDNDVGSCPNRSYNFNLFSFDPNIQVVFDPPGGFQSAAAGATVTFGVSLSASELEPPGLIHTPFDIFDFTSFVDLNGELVLDLRVPDCFVFRRRELMITDVSVVDDPARALGAGAWSLGHVLRELAPTPADGPALALQLFQHFLTDQAINGFTVPARPAAQQAILDIWPRTETGELDLDQAPFRLQAIVNRVDLRDLAAGSAGQGRLVYALDGGSFFPQSFTVILEYNLPAQTQDELMAWAHRWHALSALPFPSAAYNAALAEVTRLFTDRAAGGARLFQLRTNEIALSFNWELREFQISPATGFLVETTVAETPDVSFNGTFALASFINANAAAFSAVVPGANSHVIPLLLDGRPFVAGSAPNFPFQWFAPGADEEARFHFALNTCNGCHGLETNTGFTMITPRFPGSEARLSPFLTGTTVFSPGGTPRVLNDLARRRQDLAGLVCP
jgi:hypothetical protein